MYPAWFTAGHVIFPNVEKMGPENLKNIDIIFNNIKGKDNIHGQEQQEGDPILIQARKIMISKTIYYFLKPYNFSCIKIYYAGKTLWYVVAAMAKNLYGKDEVVHLGRLQNVQNIWTFSG